MFKEPVTAIHRGIPVLSPRLWSRKEGKIKGAVTLTRWGFWLCPALLSHSPFLYRVGDCMFVILQARLVVREQRPAVTLHSAWERPVGCRKFYDWLARLGSLAVLHPTHKRSHTGVFLCVNDEGNGVGVPSGYLTSMVLYMHPNVIIN